MKRRDLISAAAVGATLAAMRPGAAAAQPARRLRIGVSVPAPSNVFLTALHLAAQEATARMAKANPGLKISLIASDDAAAQIRDIAEMGAAGGLDALIVAPIISDALTDAVRAAKDTGTFVTVVDRGLSEGGLADLYVSGDNAGYGHLAGDYFATRLEPGANIVALRGLPATSDNDRVAAFQRALDGSDVKLLEMQRANGDRSDAQTMMQDYLEKYPRIDAVWAGDDDMALGVLDAIVAAGRADEMWVIGGTGQTAIIKRIIDGDRQLPVDITYPPDQIATAIAMTVMHLVSGAPIKGRLILAAELITPANAPRFYHPDRAF